jgi:hypothetical protein
MPFQKFKIDAAVADVSWIVKELGWGGNKLIRGGGVRITRELKPWKEWEVVKDPYLFLEEDCLIGSGKGKRIIRIVFNYGNNN